MSYNPNQIQRAFDKLHSAWEYINWECNLDEEGAREAKNLISSVTQEFIRETYRIRKNGKLDINAGHERGKKWSRRFWKENN